MIKRLYAHNYRCFQNFELKLGTNSTFLLIGRNGAGKSTVRRVLEILQAVARGENRVRSLVKPQEFSRAMSSSSPRQDQTERMRFELECEIETPSNPL